MAKSFSQFLIDCQSAVAHADLAAGLAAYYGH